MPRYVGRHRPYEGRHRPPAAAARSTSGAGSALFRGPRNMLRPALAGGLAIAIGAGAITMAEAQDVVPAKPGTGVALTADPADQNSAALAAARASRRMPRPSPFRRSRAGPPSRRRRRPPPRRRPRQRPSASGRPQRRPRPRQSPRRRPIQWRQRGRSCRSSAGRARGK